LLVPIYCHENKKNHHSMDMMVAVRRGFSKFDALTRSARKGHSITFEYDMKKEEEREEEQQVLFMKEEQDKAETLTLTAVVLATLAMSCLTGLAMKSCIHTRTESQHTAKKDQDVPIAKEASSLKSLSDVSSKVQEKTWPTWLPEVTTIAATPDPQSPSQSTISIIMPQPHV